MINKRLIGVVSESKKYIMGNVILQWCSLTANIIIVFSIAFLLQNVFQGSVDEKIYLMVGSTLVLGMLIRFLATIGAAKMGFLSSKSVKKVLRKMIYSKLLTLGAAYKEKVSTSEILQVSVEGVEQLETYFGSYLPQFFYSMIAPITLFIVISFINLPAALVLLAWVPLIPITIALVQTFAKKLLAKYWGQYTTLGDSFLENLQGLTTLKIYQTDGYKNQEMNKESEKFRKITMKVLSMQLNSVTVMDLIAYSGAALGIVIAVLQFQGGKVDLFGCLAIILLSAEFFIPMRLLGSYFHVAMNGMAASEKIFRLLDLLEHQKEKELSFPKKCNIICTDLHFSYEPQREILHGIDLVFPEKSFTGIVGESGSGKSTIASILMGRNKNYTGEIRVGNLSLSDIKEESLYKNITYIGHDSYLFKGRIKDSLLMGNPRANDAELWEALEKVNLAEFLKNENGLDTELLEKASNLSGGQRQRLALARAILHDTPIYIFDEATSNIDVESENDIMNQIRLLSKTKTVILITHRLANTQGADRIYTLKNGSVAEFGKHEDLLNNDGVYKKLFKSQSELENYNKELQHEKKK